jgi:hypothetical protein
MPGEIIISQELNSRSGVEVRGEVLAAADAPVSDVLSRYLEEQKNDYCAWQILLFFSEHPYVRFNRLAVIHALNHENGRRHIQLALDELTGQGVLKVSTEGNLPLYSLADGVRGLIHRLTRTTRKG